MAALASSESSCRNGRRSFGIPELNEAIDRGVAYIVSRQQSDGSWPHERATGVFFNTAVLDYRLYRQVFPAWALARWQTFESA